MRAPTRRASIDASPRARADALTPRLARVVVELRAQAHADLLEADRLEVLFAERPPLPGSAAESCVPAARARAADKLDHADHLEAGTWLAHLHDIGRCVATLCVGAHA